jgi:hypothetical protein
MMLVQVYGPCQGMTANLWKTAVAVSGLMVGLHSEKPVIIVMWELTVDQMTDDDFLGRSPGKSEPFSRSGSVSILH